MFSPLWNTFSEITSRRLQQFRVEDELDENLRNGYDKCPILVTEYLLKSRELNRRMGSVIYSSGYSGRMDRIKSQLDFYDRLNRITSPEGEGSDICRLLPVVIEEIDRKLC